MIIRKTTYNDIDEVMAVYARARAFMAEHGNPLQWGPTCWPPRELILKDIAEGKSYVCEDLGRIAGTFFFDMGWDVEPGYLNITGGKWKSDEVYGVIHRLAASGIVKGVGEAAISWAKGKCGHLRIDTHGDNKVMQSLLSKLGFEKRGIIYVKEDNYPRLAYEIVCADDTI